MRTRLLTKILIVLALIAVVSASAFGAIDSANKRRSSANEYEVPDGGINTAGERRASAGDYSFGLGDGGGSGCRKLAGDDLGGVGSDCP